MTEKNYRFFVPGGGVFSRFLQCAIIPLADIDFDNVYLVPSDLWLESPGGGPISKQIILDHLQAMKEYGIVNPYEQLFNYFLDQQYDTSYDFGGFLNIGPLYTSIDKIEESPRFSAYQSVARRMKFKNSVLRDIEQRSSNVDWSQTLGVHIRLTTISRHGHDYSDLSSYVRAIETMLKTGEYKSIFISSDNHESVHTIRQYFGDLIVCNDEFHRIEMAGDPDISWEFKHYFKNYYWTEAIIDCMMLAKARSLICRTSNFSNAAIVFGNYENIMRL